MHDAAQICWPDLLIPFSHVRWLAWLVAAEAWKGVYRTMEISSLNKSILAMRSVGQRLTRAPAAARVTVAMGCVSILGAIGLAAADAAGHQIDFDIYRMGAGQLLGSHLYDARLARSLMGGRPGMQFTYPPFAALLFWPFTRFAVPAGQLAWSLLNIAALLWLIGLSIGAARPHWPARQTWSLAACALLPALRLDPNGLTLGLGQVNFFIALLVLADLTRSLTLRGRTLPRGVLTGIAAAVKLTPLIFIPFLILTRQVRAAVTASVTFLICWLGMFVLASQSSRQYWTTEIFDDKRSGNLLHISDQNLQSALQRVLGHAPGPLLAGTLTILFACAGLAIAAWAHRASSPLLGLTVCAATGLIVSPVSWIHHYVWVVPVLAWLVFAADRPRGGRWWALGLAVLCWAAPPWWVPDQQQGYGGLAVLLEGNSFLLAAVAFLLLTAAMLWTRALTGSPGDERRPGDQIPEDRSDRSPMTDQDGARDLSADFVMR